MTTLMLNWDLPLPVMKAVKRLNGIGTAYIVGGAVADKICSRTPKDYDIEVFGADYDQIQALFPDYPCKPVGKAFGILKLTIDGVEIDINVPRVDNSTGVGHSDFIAELDPRMTVKDAARRRDFTINTLAYDPVERCVLNHWGGLEDLNDRILRATDLDLFVQDPLRGLRAMQLLARKADSVDPHTVELVRGMLPGLRKEPKERVHGEIQKLVLKASEPSVGIKFLVASGLIDLFPLIKKTIGCPQNLEWHPEGDVFTHSCLALDAAAQIRDYIPEDQVEAFMFGVFLHDIGKPETTVTQRMIDNRHPWVKVLTDRTGKAPQDLLLTAISHDKQGMDPAEETMRQMTDKKSLIKLVRGIVGEHMQGYNLKANEAHQGGYARLHRRMKKDHGGSLRLLAHVCQCDACATSSDWQTRSLTTGGPNWEHETSERMLDYAEKFEKDESLAEPLVQGRDLIERGIAPGPIMGKILTKMLERQYDEPSLSKETLMDTVMLEECGITKLF